MTKIFTRNDVLRYIFNETSEEENIEIEKKLLIDAQLREYYNDMLDIILELKKVEITAPKKVVDNILEYSKSRSLQFFH